MVAYSGQSSSQGGVIGVPDAAAFLPEVWVTDAIRARQRMFGMANYVMTKSFAGSQGDTIRVPYIGRVKTRRKLPGQPYVFESKREGEWKMVVDRHSYGAVSIDRKLDIQSSIDLQPAYSQSIGEALAEEIELALLAERATFISYDATNNHITSTNPISYADFLAAFGRAIEIDSNPANWCWQVSPLQFVTMFNIDQFIKSVQYNSGEVADIPSGTVVGTILGSPVVINQSIRANNATTGYNLGGYDYQDVTSEDVQFIATPGMADSLYLPTQYGSDRHSFTLNTFLTAGYHSALYLHKSAISMAVQLSPEMRMWYDEDYGETRFLGQQIYDIKTQDPLLGIVISTDEENLVA